MRCGPYGGSMTIRARKMKNGVNYPLLIEGYPRDLLRLLEADKSRGREALVKHLAPIVMTPKGEGDDRRYLATFAFDLSVTLRALSGAVKCSSGGKI